jgi:hypothetical protein
MLNSTGLILLKCVSLLSLLRGFLEIPLELAVLAKSLQTANAARYKLAKEAGWATEIRTKSFLRSGLSLPTMTGLIPTS